MVETRQAARAANTSQDKHTYAPMEPREDLEEPFVINNLAEEQEPEEEEPMENPQAEEAEAQEEEETEIVPEIRTYVRHISDGGNGLFPLLLRSVMHHLGYEKRPTYHCVRHMSTKYPDYWIVSVHIAIRSTELPTFRDESIHVDGAPRDSINAGISEAARRALYVMCHTRQEELKDTQFKLFPQRAHTASKTEIPVSQEMSYTVDMILSLLAAVNSDLDAAMIELAVAKTELLQVRRERDILEARIKGSDHVPPEWKDASDDEEDEVDIAYSPPRKLARYEDDSYRTFHMS